MTSMGDTKPRSAAETAVHERHRTRTDWFADWVQEWTVLVNSGFHCIYKNSSGRSQSPCHFEFSGGFIYLFIIFFKKVNVSNQIFKWNVIIKTPNSMSGGLIYWIMAYSYSESLCSDSSWPKTYEFQVEFGTIISKSLHLADGLTHSDLRKCFKALTRTRVKTTISLKSGQVV